jgi:hypothetical protein
MTPEILSWVLSATSGLMLWQMGNRSKWGPRLGIANQVLWITYAVWLRQWGLLPGVIAYTVIHVRNLMRWERAAASLSPGRQS